MWESRDGAGFDEGGSFGEPAHGEGLHPNQVFSIERVFSFGVAALKEQPALVLLAGFNLLLMQILRQFANYPVAGLIAYGQITGSLSEVEAEVLTNISSFILSMAFVPATQLVMAGAMVGVARWVCHDEVSIAALYSSVRPALRALLTAVVSAFIGIGAVLVLLLPVILVGVLAVAYGVLGTFVGLLVGGLLFVVAFIGLLYVSMGLLLAPYAAVLDDLGPFDALRVSWDSARGARITLFFTSLAFAVLSALACCFFAVPAIPVLGIHVAGFTTAWLLHARQPETARDWAFLQRNFPYLVD